jgi:hypothetical protein
MVAPSKSQPVTLPDAEPRSLAIGTIPVDPSDDASDRGGNSNWVSPELRTTDPNSHTPIQLNWIGTAGIGQKRPFDGACPNGRSWI